MCCEIFINTHIYALLGKRKKHYNGHPIANTIVVLHQVVIMTLHLIFIFDKEGTRGTSIFKLKQSFGRD